MKVQQIKKDVVAQGLDSWGTVGVLGTTPVEVSGRQIVIKGSETIDTGIFECSAGAYRRSVKQAEVMHFFAGSGKFTADGEDTIYFASGDTLFFEANTEGLWEIEEAMRKLYVIF